MQICYCEDIPHMMRLTGRVEESVRRVVAATERGQEPSTNTTKGQYDLAVQVTR